jgi:hypothetical protein
MTQTEFYKNVAEGTITDEVIDFAKVRYDKANEKAQAIVKEQDEFDAKLIKALEDAGEPQPGKYFADLLDVHTSKISASVKRINAKTDGLVQIDKTSGKNVYSL